MRDLIITPFGDDRLVLFPGRPGAVRLPPGHYAQLAQSAGTSLCPDWLADVILAHWRHDVHGVPLERVPGSAKKSRATSACAPACDLMRQGVALRWPGVDTSRTWGSVNVGD